MTGFVHLRVHSEYSIEDGLVRIKPLMEHAVKTQMPAVGVTDRTNFYALIKLYKSANAAGIKLILGSDFIVIDENDTSRKSLICLLAANKQGYQNIIELMSRAYLEGQQLGIPYVQKSWLSEYNEGVIALSGAREGDVGQAILSNKLEISSEKLFEWMKLYPNRFYLEVQRCGREGDEKHLHGAVALAAQAQCPLVATNDVRFLNRDEYEAHEARVCIFEGRALDDPRRPRIYSDQQYLRSADEMKELFIDLPEALQNSVEIAKRCNVELELGIPHLPDYPIPHNMDLEEFFRQRCNSGLDARLDVLFDSKVKDFPEKQRSYRQRLDFELEVILEMGFPGYFLIVMDFIEWARNHAIPVGPGRGSGAGSLVAYALKITDLDPMQYGLLFERFLNPERVSMPDFDVDFCMENRDRVINYVAQNYGRDAVSQIITFGTMAAKAVVRDVARVQGKSYSLADKLSKMIPFEVGITLSKALEQEAPLQEFLGEDQQAQEIWDMAEKLEGVIRNVGKHAGGVVIAPSKLTDFSPLFCDESGGGLVTQFDKNDVEDAGLVKFDFLGLRTLTIIDWAVKIINLEKNKLGEKDLEIERIPLDDDLSFSLLKSAETTAVFQLESRGMKDLIKRLQPDCFEDIIALVALFRPGPLQSGMVENFINRKHGREVVSYPDAQYQHEWLQPILEPTYGIILYQEQVMQIAQKLAGYSLGGADMLRRAMGKKKPEEMVKQREVFESGAAAKGIQPHLAMKIFDLVEKFAGYGFNKSHSAAYALVSYQTAWLKAHYPAQFMAAVMSSELQNTDKIVVLVEECRRMQLPLKLPDVNRGEYMFSVNLQAEIVYGLGAIKGLGEGPVENIIAERSRGGSFKDLFDFCERTDPRKVNKRAIDALIRSGAFDTLDVDRAVMLASMDEAVKTAEQSAHNRESGMIDLFGKQEANVYHHFLETKSLSSKERLNGERETLGLYVTGHPIDEYEIELRGIAPNRISDLRADGGKSQLIAGLLVSIRTMKTKRGDTMAIIMLDDRSARIEITIYSDVYLENREKLVKDSILIVDGSVTFDDYSGGLGMRGKGFRTITEARRSYATELTISIAEKNVDQGFAIQLGEHLSVAKGGKCPVTLLYFQQDNFARVTLGTHWWIDPSDNLLQKLRDVYGAEHVTLRYPEVSGA